MKSQLKKTLVYVLELNSKNKNNTVKWLIVTI